MNIETLEQYYGLASNIEAIEREIQVLYSPIRSPIGSGSGQSEPGDPTERSAMRIIMLKEKLEQERTQMLELAEEIEEWLLTVRDTELVSIIRWHYILRLNWKQTNVKVYGYPDYNYSRQKVIRYFQKVVRIE
jgi:hypothetical protein